MFVVLIHVLRHHSAASHRETVQLQVSQVDITTIHIVNVSLEDISWVNGSLKIFVQVGT